MPMYMQIKKSASISSSFSNSTLITQNGSPSFNDKPLPIVWNTKQHSWPNKITTYYARRYILKVETTVNMEAHYISTQIRNSLFS